MFYCRIMLDQTKTVERLARHKITQEDFTPDHIVSLLCDDNCVPLYTDFSKTFCDMSVGIGHILLFILRKRLEICESYEDGLKAVSTLYATELLQDNVDILKETIIELFDEKFIDYDSDKLMEIIDHNIVCTDIDDWDYDNWKSIPKSNVLF